MSRNGSAPAVASALALSGLRAATARHNAVLPSCIASTSATLLANSATTSGVPRSAAWCNTGPAHPTSAFGSTPAFNAALTASRSVHPCHPIPSHPFVMVDNHGPATVSA